MGVRHSAPTPYLRSLWVSDDRAPLCAHCASPFALRLRRHHCRCCGAVFCRRCWGKAATLPPEYGYQSAAEPVCGVCHELLEGTLRALLQPRCVAVMSVRRSVAGVAEPPLSRANVSARAFKVMWIKLAVWRPFGPETRICFSPRPPETASGAATTKAGGTTTGAAAAAAVPGPSESCGSAVGAAQAADCVARGAIDPTVSQERLSVKDQAGLAAMAEHRRPDDPPPSGLAGARGAGGSGGSGSGGTPVGSAPVVPQPLGSPTAGGGGPHRREQHPQQRLLSTLEGRAPLDMRAAADPARPRAGLQRHDSSGGLIGALPPAKRQQGQHQLGTIGGGGGGSAGPSSPRGASPDPTAPPVADPSAPATQALPFVTRAPVASAAPALGGDGASISARSSAAAATGAVAASSSAAGAGVWTLPLDSVVHVVLDHHPEGAFLTLETAQEYVLLQCVSVSAAEPRPAPPPAGQQPGRGDHQQLRDPDGAESAISGFSAVSWGPAAQRPASVASGDGATQPGGAAATVPAAPRRPKRRLRFTLEPEATAQLFNEVLDASALMRQRLSAAAACAEALDEAAAAAAGGARSRPGGGATSAAGSPRESLVVGGGSRSSVANASLASSSLGGSTAFVPPFGAPLARQPSQTYGGGGGGGGGGFGDGPATAGGSAAPVWAGAAAASQRRNGGSAAAVSAGPAAARGVPVRS